MARKGTAVSSIILAVLCVVPVGVAAQKKGKPDFSGKWLLDESKSKIPFKKSSKKPSVVDPTRRNSELIIIKHADPEFAVTGIRRVERFDDSGALIDKTDTELSRLIFYTDRRGETNFFQSSQSHPSTTTWDGKSIFVSVNTDKRRAITSILKFTLSADAKEMTILNLSFQLTHDTTTSQDYFLPAAVGSKKVYRKIDQ